MNVRTLIAACAIVAVTGATGLAFAQAGPGGGQGPGQGRMNGGFGPGGGPGGGLGIFRMLDRLCERLGLSEEQQAEIEAIIDEEQPAIEALRSQMEANRDAYRASVEPGQFDETTVRTHAESQAALMVDMKVATAKVKARLYSVLTAEQQQQLLELREQRQSCGKRGGRGHGRGPGGGGFGF